MNDHPITSYRKSRGITLNDFAGGIGVSRSYVCQWEQGKRRVPAERAVIIEQIYGIPREELRPDLYTREASQ